MQTEVMKRVAEVMGLFEIFEDEMGVFHTYNAMEDCWELTYLTAIKAVEMAYVKCNGYVLTFVGANHA